MGGKQSHREVFSPFSDLFYFILFFRKSEQGIFKKTAGIYISAVVNISSVLMIGTTAIK